MAFEQKNNSGALFRNERATADTHPSHKGTIRVDGRDYWLDAWVNTAKDGRRFFSLRVKPKDAPPAEAKADAQTQADLDDSIPF